MTERGTRRREARQLRRLAGAKMPCEAVEFTLGNDAWDDTGPDGTEWGRISARVPVIINGVRHHLEGVCLNVAEDGMQNEADGTFPGDYDALQSIHSGSYETITVRGRQYALYMLPHGD